MHRTNFEHIRVCRAPFLDFLRNLTSQTLLLSSVILMSAKLDFSHFDFDLANIIVTSAFYVLVLSFGFSIYASSTIFIEKCFPGLLDWRAQQEKLLKNVKWYRRPDYIILAVIKEKLFPVIGFCTVILFIQTAVTIVIALSLNSATRIWKETHPSLPAHASTESIETELNRVGQKAGISRQRE